MKPGLPYPAIAAKVNNVTKDLKMKVMKPKTVEFISHDVPSGMRAYVRSLSFILCNAVNKLYPNVTVRLEHPIANGYYCKLIGCEERIDQEMVDSIKTEMHRIVDADIQFNQITMPTDDAIRIGQLRADMARRVIRDFLDSLNKLGISHGEAARMIEEEEQHAGK